ncbi:hypothetical protein PMIN03_007796 [Paraphaeosphaeria minitans]
MRLQSKGIKNADTLLNPLRGPSSQTNPTSRKPSIPPTARTTPNTNHIATRQLPTTSPSAMTKTTPLPASITTVALLLNTLPKPIPKPISRRPGSV